MWSSSVALRCSVPSTCSECVRTITLHVFKTSIMHCCCRRRRLARIPATWSAGARCPCCPSLLISFTLLCRRLASTTHRTVHAELVCRLLPNMSFVLKLNGESVLHVGQPAPHLRIRHMPQGPGDAQLSKARQVGEYLGGITIKIFSVAKVQVFQRCGCGERWRQAGKAVVCQGQLPQAWHESWTARVQLRWLGLLFACRQRQRRSRLAA